MNKIIFAVMLCLVTAAVVGGFMVVGGPENARAEARDSDRVTLLMQTRRTLLCNGDAAQPLPRGLDDASYCSRERANLDGPYATGPDGIQYDRQSDAAFELCITLETASPAAVRRMTVPQIGELREGNRLCVSGDNGYRG